MSDGLPPSLAALTIDEHREFQRYVERMGYTEILNDPEAFADLLWHWHTYNHIKTPPPQPTTADSQTTVRRSVYLLPILCMLVVAADCAL